MSVIEKFNNDYAKSVSNKQYETIKSFVDDLRQRLQNEKTKLKAEQEFSELIVKSNDTLSKCIKVFLSFDNYAFQLFKGNANRVGETIQPTFLKQFVKQQTNKEIEFNKPKQNTIVNGVEVYYTISNQMNNYNKNTISDWSNKKLNNETVLLVCGKSYKTIYTELKAKNTKNLKVLDIEEFIEWINNK